MEEFLIKLNMVKNHNTILRLKNENIKKDKKFIELKNNTKKLIDDYATGNREIITNLKFKINELEEENSKLNSENIFYKNTINKIPKFIFRIFVGKNKMLEEGKNG